MLRKSVSALGILFFLSLLLGLLITAKAQSGYDPTVQTQMLLYDEARTVYLGNLARRDNGVPPLRWNRQLTYAARWFSWDSTENRPAGFCGHQDSQGHEFYYRTSAFGYLGFAGAENAFCSYVSPEAAIQGWMNSGGHRTNLLNPNSRETGVGYYRRDSDGRGYVTQDFGNDDVYAPTIIANEAISTTSPNVNLYIYDRSTGGGFEGLSAATQMMVSNNPYFDGAAWEPYNANKAWTLTSGSGWRDVYVKTRDKFNRTLTVSDTIYLGTEANVPLNEIGTGAQMSTTQSQVTLYTLNGGSLPQVQFSLGWLADDTLGSFGKLWGNGEPVNDAVAWGGTAYRLYPGNGESFAWVYNTSFIQNIPMVAYFRLKVNDNTSNSEVARISVQGGPTEYGPLSLRGTDFTSPNIYQEFAINFTFNPTSNDPFLIFNFWRSGVADLYVDAVSIFSAPQAITSPLTWSVPGSNYRGQGVWVRYTNGSQFSALSEAVTIQHPSYAISGNAGIDNATLNYVDGVPKSVTADGSGNYTFNVPSGWNGVVTPGKACYSFTPPNRSYSNVIADQPGQDYVATYNASASYTLTGNTTLPGVTLSYTNGTPQTTVSDGNGNYSITVPCSWNGTVTPSKTGYLFGPAVRNYSTLTADQSNQNFNLYNVAPADFNGDGKTDVAVFRPSNNTWYIYGIGPSVYGTAGDIPVPADYNGDGKDEIAVFRPSNSTWYIYGVGSFVYGAAGDIPVVADYNGDGKADIAVFRPTNSTWYIYGQGSFAYGTDGDIPVVADYNGDGKADIAVFRPTNSTWYLYGIGPRVYGTVGDIPVIADYNGDGKADVAVFRPSNSTWYIYGIGPSVYGTVGDIPAIGDYNGDGKADITVFRPTNSTWYKYGVGPSVYGTLGDIPV